MEYERIHKPLPRQGGGFSVSPKKLRSLLLGIEKKHKEEEAEQPKTTDQEISQSLEIPQSDNRGASAVDYQDMECTTSASISIININGPQKMTKVGHRNDEDSLDSDSMSFGFEFQKQEKVPVPSATVPVQRFTMVHSFPAPFSKPAPSKWDDAEKWISSPNSNVKGNGKINSKVGLLVNKVVVVNGKKVDLSKVKKLGVVNGSGFGLGTAKGKGMSWVDEPFELTDLGVEEGGFGAAKPVFHSAASVHQNNVPEKNQLNSVYDAPLTPEVRSVSMRDMGTEMTPIPSQEPSRTTTPARATSPSQHPAARAGDGSELDLQVKTKREIMELSEQLGKPNIAAWAAKELTNQMPDQSSKTDLETRAADWEEAEKSKYLTRFKRDEARIQAWENHQKAKIEAEMQKIEVDLEKIRARSQEKLMNKLAASKHKANQKRAAAEAKRQKEATRTTKQAEYIRQTGHVPNQSCSSCWSLWF
ncbi:Remorin family protein [Rhynchospora pubera]|uniref:Remorin family protein n=1 Tax=Rhynchospora pubera TaxID=906938 RepID=A0AAV8EFQ7_9POAL|nr:Remorin family protein [Rhynchospora pubera]